MNKKINKNKIIKTTGDSIETPVDNISLLNECKKTKYIEQPKPIEKYFNEIETLKQEFGKFLRIADKSINTNKNKLHLILRKKSIELRNSLKKFREKSLEHEKYLEKIKSEKNGKNNENK